MTPVRGEMGIGRHVAPPPTPEAPRYPEIEIDFLALPTGQAMAVAIAVERALKKGGVDKERRVEFLNLALARNSADQVLAECLCWVSMKLPEE